MINHKHFRGVCLMYKERKIDLGKKSEKLNKYFESKNEILTVYIFGSHGTCHENKMSDIDFGILFKNPLPLMEELTIAGEIEMIMSKEIDLISLNKVNINLKYKIIKTGKIIYEDSEIKTANFIEQVLKNYFDFGFKLKNIKHDFHVLLKEDDYGSR